MTAEDDDLKTKQQLFSIKALKFYLDFCILH